jgi:ubiquinol-cytochrome c reductase cytochrome c1 subunit
MKKLAFLFLALPLFASASEKMALDRLPAAPDMQTSMQRGARNFVNHCLNCHGAAYFRYSKLQDIGLSEKQIKDNLMFATDKIGDTMKTSMDAKSAKEWFGAAPPDLSVIARSRSNDWLYTYLRSFYRDDTRPSGWNNLAFPNVGMPHVMYDLQGEQVLEEHKAPAGHGGEAHVVKSLKLVKAGSMSPAEYDNYVRDTVNFLSYVAEPIKETRFRMGIWVMFFLTALFFVMLGLKKEIWKNVK